MAVEVGAARRRIIRRPRLTAMLDESSSQIRMLIAPAGYGKTTLAREWLGEPERRDVWYRGGPATADVAALAAGVAEAASGVVPDAGKRMRERIRATGHPEEDVDILAELFAEDVQSWPVDAWLAIDDYQFAMESAASERFVDLLTQLTPIQILITSRRRPSWATARRILYDEIFEIDRRALAMEDAEAKVVLGSSSGPSRTLIDLAQGWPAILGLASMVRELEVPEAELPDAVYEYVASEVLQGTDSRFRRAFGLLAYAPVVTVELAAVVVGAERAPELIATGHRLGILTTAEGAFSIHPLLREALHPLQPEPHLANDISRVCEHFLARGEWDAAYEVAASASVAPLLARAIELALDPLLGQGRLATIQRWIDEALAARIASPIIDLAEAELSFRRGEHQRAQVLALQAAARLQDRRDLAARAYIRAGHSALLAGEEQDGLAYFQRAHAAATSWPQQRESLVGIYFAASELDEPAAAAALASLQVTDDTSPDGILRLEVLRLTRAGRTGGIGPALDEARPKAHLLERAEEPLGITAFLHMLATASNLAAEYAEADEYARKLLAVAAEYRLNLPEIHAHLNQAISALGRRAFQRAATELDHVRKRIPRTGDAYLEPTIRVITCRSLLMRQRFEEAVELTQDRAEAISSLPFRAEYLSCRALACACVGDFRESGQLLDDAEANYPASVELRVLRACVDAAIARRDQVQGGESALAVWRAAAETGNYDSLVCAYRADPELLGDLRAADAEADTLLARANDASLARKYGFKTMVSEELSPLTARETEVLRELEQGASNREIAQRLFVSESTVKVHLRHIYEKLGVKGRTELLARRVRQR